MFTMIVSIKGLVKHSIIIDPGVWIFDDRQINLDTYFTEEQQTINDPDPTIKNLSQAWSKHRQFGSVPQTNDNKITINKTDVIKNPLGISLAPFLANAAPLPEASEVKFIRNNRKEEFICSIEVAKKGILGFSNQGKPLTEDGPVHFYYGDGSNRNNPITNIQSIIIN